MNDYLIFQLCIKMYTAKYGSIVADLMDEIIAIYAANAKSKSPDRLKLMKLFSTITEVVLKGGFLVYCFGGLFYLINPIYSYYFKHELIPLIPVYVIFVDETTKYGFIALAIIHLSLLTMTVIGSASTDFLFITLIANMPVLSTIFVDNVEELSGILKEHTVNIALVRAKLKNIMLMHKQICE